MKPFKNIFRTLALGWAIVSLAACAKDNADGPFVDLRYRFDAEDFINIDCYDPAVVTFVVRSLNTPWEVYGDDGSWYTITPSHGEAGESVTVTIQCDPNLVLDDREDMIHIKSDYWTGADVRLHQKGTAYLEADDMTLEKAGDSYKLSVSSNQKWSAAVTEGLDWLKITSGQSGEFDGDITFAAIDNLSEQREGIITLYDRYDRPTVDVVVTQKGVVLNWYKPYGDDDPAPAEDPVEWIRVMDPESHTYEIPLESNAIFNVTVEDPDTMDWFTIEQTHFDNDGDDPIPHTLKLNISANDLDKVRTGVVVLTTVPEGGAEELVKTITFKQANVPVVTIFAENKTVSGTAKIKDGLPAGRYDFKVKGDNGKSMMFTFYYTHMPYQSNGARELRYWTNRANGTDDGIPMMSTMPWVNNPFNIDQCVANATKNENPGTYAVFDKSQEHTLSLIIEKARFDDYDEACAYISWLIDDQILALGGGGQVGKMPSKADGKILNTTNWDMSFDDMNVPNIGYINADGNFTIIEAKHTDVIDWSK